MSIDNDKYFDEMIKEKIMEEAISVPNDITNNMRNVLSSLPDKPKKKYSNTFEKFLTYMDRIKMPSIIAVATFIFILIIIPNYAAHEKRPSSNKDVSKVKNVSGNVKHPPLVNKDIDLSYFSNVKANDVEFITKTATSPFASDFNYSMLFSNSDSEKINKIINLIKNSSSFHKSTEEELAPFMGKGPYPNYIMIKMKNGDELGITTGYEVKTKKLDNGAMEIDKTPSKNIFMLDYSNTPKTYGNHYTFSLNDQESSELYAAFNYFHEANPINIKPKDYKMGQQITITGEGYMGKEVDICLRSNNDGNDNYIIAKVKTENGTFKWVGTIDRQMKDFDGGTINLHGNMYEIITICNGDTKFSPNALIDLSKK